MVQSLPPALTGPAEVVGCQPAGAAGPPPPPFSCAQVIPPLVVRTNTAMPFAQAWAAFGLRDNHASGWLRLQIT